MRIGQNLSKFCTLINILMPFLAMQLTSLQMNSFTESNTNT
jgi:hypothetical protein